MSRIETEMNRLMKWNDKFNIFSQNFTLLEKKKALLSSLKTFEPYASKVVFKNMSILKNDILSHHLRVKNHWVELNKAMNMTALLNSDKTNLFELKKQLNAYKAYNRYLKSLNQEVVKKSNNDDDSIDSLLQTIAIRKKELLELIKKRLAFLVQRHQELDVQVQKDYKAFNEAFKNDCLKAFDSNGESSILFRNLKALHFITKELMVSKTLLKDSYTQTLDKKYQNKIDSQMKQVDLCKREVTNTNKISQTTKEAKNNNSKLSEPIKPYSKNQQKT